LVLFKPLICDGGLFEERGICQSGALLILTNPALRQGFGLDARVPRRAGVAVAMQQLEAKGPFDVAP